MADRLLRNYFLKVLAAVLNLDYITHMDSKQAVHPLRRAFVEGEESGKRKTSIQVRIQHRSQAFFWADGGLYRQQHRRRG